MWSHVAINTAHTKTEKDVVVIGCFITFFMQLPSIENHRYSMYPVVYFEYSQPNLFVLLTDKIKYPTLKI